MARTLTDDDVKALAVQLVDVLTQRLSAPPPAREEPTTSAPQLKPKLAFTLKELSEELGLSKATLYRLEARGLLKSLPHLRHKVFARKEVERFLAAERD